jgi:dihydroxyacetone kinase-like predicted kinase
VSSIPDVAPGSGPAGIRAEFLESIEDEAWGYCTVFAIEGEGLDTESVRNQMDDIGRSAVVAGGANLIKVHVHMEDPGAALSAGLKLGTLSNIDIHNMDEQAKEWASGQAEATQEPAEVTVPVNTAIVCVAIGQGFVELIKNAGYGAVVIVSGGDSMNPSTADILTAVESAPSNNVIVLPNNKNVIGTAEQAAELSDKEVRVLHTRSMQAGLAALLEFQPDREIEKNSLQMDESQSILRSGSVSIASRDALMDGVAVKQGKYMGVLDGRLVAAGESSLDVLKQMLAGQVDEESLLTLYGGAEISAKALQQTADVLCTSLHGIEIEIQSGGQPDYDFLLSIE